MTPIPHGPAYERWHGLTGWHLPTGPAYRAFMAATHSLESDLDLNNFALSVL